MCVYYRVYKLLFKDSKCSESSFNGTLKLVAVVAFSEDSNY